MDALNRINTKTTAKKNQKSRSSIPPNGTGTALYNISKVES